MDQNIEKSGIPNDTLDDINRELSRAQKTISEAFKSYPFQDITRMSEKMNEVARQMTANVQPYLKQITKSQEFYKKLIGTIPKIEPITNTTSSPLPPTNSLKLKKSETKEKQPTEAELFKIIEDIVSLKIEEKIKTEKINTKHKFPYKLPKNTKWESITIKFIDGENIQIVTDTGSYKAHYSEMGLKDGRTLSPNQQWVFLKLLSTHNGETSIKAQDFNPKIKKQKQLLADSLKKYFGLDSDPFYPYKKEKIYRIKINLISDSQSINSGLVKSNEYQTELDDPLGIEGAYKDITGDL
jgi:hypothetical protein